MQYILAGLLLSSVTLVAQQSQPSINWNVIIVAFLTGAFGSNGLAKIIDSLWNIRRAATIRKQLEEAQTREESCQDRVNELERTMQNRYEQHQKDIARLRRDLGNRL